MPTSILSPEVQEVLNQARAARAKRVSVNGETVEISKPFASPPDWRDQWIYFLLVDRFNNPRAGPNVTPFDGMHNIFQGGTFQGVRSQLDYLKQLGAGAIWLSPVLKNCKFRDTYHGYGIQDFLNVEPRLTSNPGAARANPKLAEEELQALVDEAHARGIYVIFDIVLNHSGDVFEYVLPDGRRVAEAGFRDSPYTINWRDENGRGRPEWETRPDNPMPDAAIWPAELQRSALFRRQGMGGESGGDFYSLKELITDFAEFDANKGVYIPVRDILIRAYQYIIAKYDVDGFRIDTLKYIEPDFARVFGNAMREFALGIGKKNFFTFGEVYDNEEQIARFIGRNAAAEGDVVGVDAALDFPLFFKLPMVAKGRLAPAEVSAMYEHRKQVARNVISSHGEASRYFVTFLDNHDQNTRFYFSEPDAPTRFADQLTLGIACLFTLQGIPSIYYGTEQGLHGAGDGDAAVREALWGKPNAFDRAHPFYATIQRLSAIRESRPALRYGRQYFRPISGDGAHFGISPFSEGVVAFSRILNDDEVVIIANTSSQSDWTGEVIVDFSLNPVGANYTAIFSNKILSPNREEGGAAPGPVLQKAAGEVEIYEVSGAVTRGPARALPIALARMEVQILVKTTA